MLIYNTPWILLVLTTCCVFTESLSLYDKKPSARIKRQNKCGRDEYQCGSGECISEDYLCDGAENCRDGSDESSCSNIRCQSFLFKCAYGACINKDLVCDGKKDCKDNSDEAKCLNGNTGSTISTKCGRDKFTCDNGDCIDDFDLCDGKQNCNDASDESIKACGSQKCPRFSHKCDYGACINADLKCNGANDCYDGSDEKNCPGVVTPKPPIVVTPSPITTTTTSTIVTRNPDNGIQPEPGRCQLPPHPTNGKWQVYGASRSYSPGENVDVDTLLLMECNTQYALYPDNKFLHCDGKWPTIPQCLKTCSSMANNENMSVKCKLNGSTVDCSKPYEGTIATLECNRLYEDPSLETRPNRFCIDGSWDYGPANCEPICGLKSTEAQPLIIGGSVAKQGDYPWMIGLYRMSDKSHICGGSMITPGITLTAAHCFEKSTDPKDYFLSAGNYYRMYQDPRDNSTQYKNVQEIKIHDNYAGKDLFYGFDIAILVLESSFKISPFVMPVCIDFNPRFEPANLVGEKGIVTGWGFTTGIDTASEVLKVLEVSYRTEQTCTLPDDFKKFLQLTRDKICAGSINQGESSCSGDSGGGLMFKRSNRYYVRGIVSVGPRNFQTNGCDANQPTLFTGVHYHTEFVQKYVNKYKKQVKMLI